MFKTCRETYQVLFEFGRFPQRNEILERMPTLKEIPYLKRLPLYKRTYLQRIKPIDKQAKKSAPVKDASNKAAPQRLLFLHGFRQNSNKMKKRLSKLLTALKLECNAHVTFLNGTHPYQESVTTDVSGDLKNPIESQRVWYNPNEDFTIYHGKL